MSVETRHDANQLAWLDPNAPQKQPLAAGTELDLPLWLAQQLHNRGDDFDQLVAATRLRSGLRARQR